MKMKMKMKKTKVTAKVLTKKVKALPDAVRKRCIKKFRVKGFDRVVTVMALGEGTNGYKVSTWTNGLETLNREFPLTAQSEVPTSLWDTAQRELAVWFARYVARHKVLPSQRNERGRRKRIWKRVVAQHQAHMAVKTTLRAITHPRTTPTVPAPKDPIRHFIVIYDPCQKLGDTYFRIHSTSCGRIDMERRRVKRPNRKGLHGDSWYLAADTAHDSVTLQLDELIEDGKGYDAADFLVHDCHMYPAKMPIVKKGGR